MTNSKLQNNSQILEFKNYFVIYHLKFIIRFYRSAARSIASIFFVNLVVNKDGLYEL